jgi:hypothetical protein
MPDFRHRLSRSQQREYDRSNAVSSIRIQVSPELRLAVGALGEALTAADRPATQRAAQAICDAICADLQLEPLRVEVWGVRPSRKGGELHGLYTPGSSGRADRIEVWMTTVKRRQVVAFKTFVRTLLHELCHYLDYNLLHLRESFHTDGFFKRESSLFRQVIGREGQVGSEIRSKPSTGPTHRRKSGD